MSMASLLNTFSSSIKLSNSNPIPRPRPTPISLPLTRRRLTIRATETDANEVKAQAPEKAPAASGSSFNQILGIKGAKQESDIWKIRVQLTKPVTWPPLIWGVVCGATASGNFHWTPEDVAKSIVCMIMSGPFLTGYTQTINDWYDREIDAINEPYRPIPSGAISPDEVITQIWVLLLGGIGLAGVLDVWAGHNFPIIFYLALGGSLLSYIYSAPPLKLKQNGWIGNFALGASYISLPWWAGQALFGTLTPDIIVLTLLYGIAGLGIAIVNDFKSVEGDRKLGLQSLPVAFGNETAKWICVGAIDITQLSVADISPWNQNRDIVTEGDGAYISSQGIQVTPDEIGSDQRQRAGRATYITPLHLWDKASGQLADFDTYFSFVIDSRGSAVHGDGLTFFLAQNNSVVSPGAAIGLPTNGTTDQGLNQYVAVEFDTYYNWEWDPVEFGNVSVGEHVGIDINSLISGNVSMSEHVGIDINSLISVKYIQWKNLSNGRLCEARVSYDSVSKNLSVTVTSSENNSTVRRSGLHHIVDLRTQLPERVIFGFTAATGGYFEKNNVKSWSFNSSDLLSDRNRSLAPTSGPNPAGNGVPTASPASPSPNQGEGKSSRKGMVVGVGVGGVLVLVLVFAVTAYVFLKGRKEEEADDELALDVGELDTEFAMGSGPKRFSYTDLSRATSNFAEGEKLGEGGFGGVYRGFLRELSSYVAVKRVSKTSSQGIKEYASEVKIISRLRHRNLVKLIGWCHEKGELLLVYDYMENGSLDLHLFKAKSLLPWQVRYKIAQGLASALLYLHEEWEQCVLHRDIKPSNIMLDANFIAKLGDFGLAKLVDHERGTKTTIVAGTRGYMAPEYIGTGKASKESDVFSFGVVMLELVCGTTAMRAKSEEDQLTLVEWVWQLYGMGKLQEAVDPKLGSDFDEKECVYLMIIGLWCAHPDSTLRPSMKQVINVLNFEAPLPPLPSKMPVATYFIPPTSSFPTSSYEAVSTKIVAASDPSLSLLYTGRIDVNDINQKMRTI